MKVLWKKFIVQVWLGGDKFVQEIIDFLIFK